jgi:hypothetical protein
MEKTNRFLIVTVPVADLRSKPVNGKPVNFHDDLRVTQVLYNETLRRLDEIDDWYYVEAREQQKYTCKNVWQGYPGWIGKRSVAMLDGPLQYNAIVRHMNTRVLMKRSEKSGVLLTFSIGTRLSVKEEGNEEYGAVIIPGNKTGYVRKDCIAGVEACSDESVLRETVVAICRLFLGVPYLWGGRSTCETEPLEERQGTNNSILSIRHPAPHAPVIGVDCSGFTNLVYRSSNIDIPRDAHEQWMAAHKVDYACFKPGDLIFISAEGKPDTIVHVMLNIDGKRFIEAAETGSAVKINTFADKFGEGLARLAEHNLLIQNKQIYLGSYISKR